MSLLGGRVLLAEPMDRQLAEQPALQTAERAASSHFPRKCTGTVPQQLYCILTGSCEVLGRETERLSLAIYLAPSYVALQGFPNS